MALEDTIMTTATMTMLIHTAMRSTAMFTTTITAAILHTLLVEINLPPKQRIIPNHHDEFVSRSSPPGTTPIPEAAVTLVNSAAGIGVDPARVDTRAWQASRI